MTTQGLRYTAAAFAVALMVAAMGALMAGPAGRGGVYAGAGLALGVQVLVFWLFMVWLYPGRQWLGYGLGLLARFALFGVVAFLVVPHAGLPLAPTLFSLVAVLWLTTMLEPAFFKPRPTKTT